MCGSPGGEGERLLGVEKVSEMSERLSHDSIHCDVVNDGR